MECRKTNVDSDFGSKFEFFADFIFVIKIINMIYGYVKYKELIVWYTVMNKVTGMLLCILPLSLSTIDLKYSGIIVSFVATLSAIQEGYKINVKAGMK